jgi:hypothetical protein
MAQIMSRYQFESWLEDKPADWAQVIAARAALRVLPYAFEKQIDQKWVKEFAPPLIRSLAISWIVGNFPAHNMAVAAYAAADAYDAAAAAAAARAATHAAAAAAAYATSAVRAAAAATYVAAAPRAARAAVDAVAYAAAYGAVWVNISDDCNWLENAYGPNAARHLTCVKLWPAGEPKDWAAVWDHASTHLRNLDQGYGVWIDWYNRRIRGEDAAFDIPGDSDRTEDKAILARLADATNEDFWDKGAPYVNTTLQGWIDAARERVRPRDAPFITDPLRQLEAAPEPIPPQNQNAIPFTATESGKIRIDQSRNADALRMDADAQDRHAEAIREARALLDRCRLSNSAARFVSGFENYLSAGGETLADLRPSLFVQRGEKLRQEIAAYESGQQDSFLEPIADDLLIDLKGWRSAHNMTVGLDPLLMRLDTAMLGPDVKPALIAPAELHAFVAEADEADILDEGVREIVDEAIDLAPAIPDANDRRTVWSVESVQNLVIEAFSVALNHPVKVAVGVSAVAVGASLGVGVGLGELVGAAGFLLAKRKWVETKLNNAPTWKALFIQLCNKAEKALESMRKSGSDGI